MQNKHAYISAKKNSWKMFDQIANSYDFLNRLISFGLDLKWRRKIGHFLPKTPDIKLLDLATGTGDVPLVLLKDTVNIKSVLAIDMSEKMLRLADLKSVQEGRESIISFQNGDAKNIPAKDEEFNVVTMAFGIRNLEDPENALKQIFRILKPKGKVIILEFSIPKNRIIKFLFRLYINIIIPFIAGIISRNFKAYKYLSETIETFAYGNEFAQLLVNAGFKDVKIQLLNFGIATIYIGDKA